jgi:hypothetical protein
VYRNVAKCIIPVERLFSRYWVRLHSLDDEKMHSGWMSVQASAYIPSKAIRLSFRNSRCLADL